MTSETRTIWPSSVERHVLDVLVEDLAAALGVPLDAVPDLEGQVEPLAVVLELLDDAQALVGVVEAVGQELAQRLLAGVAERGVAEVVAQGDGLGQVLVEAEGLGDRPGDLGDLEAVRQPRPVVVAERREEDLGLVLEAAEGLRVDDPVPVALEVGPEDVLGFGPDAALRPGAEAGLGRQELLLGLLQLFADGHRFSPRMPPIIADEGRLAPAKTGSNLNSYNFSKQLRVVIKPRGIIF